MHAEVQRATELYQQLQQTINDILDLPAADRENIVKVLRGHPADKHDLMSTPAGRHNFALADLVEVGEN